MSRYLTLTEFETAAVVMVNINAIETVEPDGLSHVMITMRGGRVRHFDGSWKDIRQQIEVMTDSPRRPDDMERQD